MDNKNKCREEINSHTLDTAGRWERKIWSLVQLNGTPGNPFLALPSGEGESHLTLAGPRSQWAEPLGRRGAELCLMDPLASVVLRSGLLLVFQSQDAGTICLSRVNLVSSPQTRGHVLALFLRRPGPQELQRSFRDAKRLPHSLWGSPLFYSQQIVPRSGQLFWCYKSPPPRPEHASRGLNPGSTIHSTVWLLINHFEL